MRKISMEKFQLFAGIFVLNVLFVDLTVLHLYRHYGPKCVDYGQMCNPSYNKPCCNPNLICNLRDLNNTFTCTDKAQLGQNCKTDEDCSKHIFRAECSKQKKCVCKSGSFQTSKIICSPLLGEYCEDYEKCEPDNSICIDNLCECDHDYLPHNDECLPMLLGEHCKNNTDCEGVTHAECSEKKECVCSQNMFQINPSRCVAESDFCVSNSQCGENKFCDNNECRCKSGLKLGPNGKCASVTLDMRCKNDEECSKLVKHSVCSAEEKCECDSFHYRTNDFFCASIINAGCTNSEICKNDFILCVDDKCHCQPNYVYDGSKCVPLFK